MVNRRIALQGRATRKKKGERGERGQSTYLD
jgi:hypothetical protein